MNLPLNLNRRSSVVGSQSAKQSRIQPSRAQHFEDSKLISEIDREQASVSMNQLIHRKKEGNEIPPDSIQKGRTSSIIGPGSRNNAKTNVIKTSSIKRSIFD